MTSVLLVDDSLRNDIHNGMILIATTLGLVATSVLGAGIFLLVKGLRTCPPPKPCPPCVPYEATCSTKCIGCPTTCTTKCYSCQTGNAKKVPVGIDPAVAPLDTTVQVA